MKTTLAVLSTFALASAAAAQPGSETFVSGLLHQPVGGATLGPVTGRRLPVNNLGSSGQDGVEINLRSATGGSAAIDLSAIAATAGAELRNAQKGWDGNIYGNHRLISNGNGSYTNVYDFSAINAPTINVEQRDGQGHVISSVNYPGPIVALPWVPNWYCSNGSMPIYYETWIKLCTLCNPVFVQGWICPGVGGGTYSFNDMRIIVTPGSGPGSPSLPPTDSMVLTARGVPSFTVYDAALDTFGVQCWGVGQAHLSEECTPDPLTGACDEGVRRLRGTAIGSSGQDGVEIGIPTAAGGVSASMNRDHCCPGHVTLIKITDEAGDQQRVTHTVTSVDPTGAADEVINADFPGYGSGGFILTCYGVTGAVVGPVGGTAVISGGSCPVCTGRCPDGMETWSNTGTTQNPIWTFQGCGGSLNMTLPGGTVLTGVSSYTIQPLNPVTTPSSRLRHVVITRNGSEIDLRSFNVLPPLPACGTADFNGDGDTGTDSDIEAFFACLAGSCCPTCGSADFNADGDIGTDADIEAFFRVLAGGQC